VELKARLVQPPTTLLLPKRPFEAAVPECFEFFVSTQSAEESARRIIDRGAVSEPRLSEFGEVIYIPLTQTSTHDPVFTALVAQTIAEAYFNPQHCVLIRLPSPNAEVADLLAQMSLALQGLRELGIVMPSVPAHNVLLLREDVPESFFDSQKTLVFMCDDSFDFWRYTPALYRRLRRLTYRLDGDPRRRGAAVQCLTKMLGYPPTGRRSFTVGTPVILHWARKAAAARVRHAR